MIAVIQRAKDAIVKIDGNVAGKIDHGLVVLLGVCKNDNEEDADFLVYKISSMRIFSDENSKMNLSVKDTGGKALVISQFTLCGDWRKGRRPSFVNAAPPDEGERLYNYFMQRMKLNDVDVESGVFGAMMDVSLINAGPVTFVLDSRLRNNR